MSVFPRRIPRSTRRSRKLEVRVRNTALVCNTTSPSIGPSAADMRSGKRNSLVNHVATGSRFQHHLIALGVGYSQASWAVDVAYQFIYANCHISDSISGRKSMNLEQQLQRVDATLSLTLRIASPV